MPVPATPTRSDAVRFLQRATFGGNEATVAELISLGIDDWIDDQLTRTPVISYFDRGTQSGGNLGATIWAGYLGDTDQLRKRWSYALSQVFVVSDHDLSQIDVAAYADLLEAHCFGTFRDLLEHITRSPAMGDYLTYLGNRAADERRGSVPDENFAREVLQLFSIGLWELNPNGTRRTINGHPIPAYGQDDILGLARVFTGFSSNNEVDVPERSLLPMNSGGEFAERYHERGEKQFLGTTIPASESRTLDESLAIALDTIADHPNVGPFLAHQLIQRLVTSNPTADYVGRVASTFNDDGTGTRGNLAAVLRVILTDDEAWQSNPPETFGKLREPVLRFTSICRSLNVDATGLPWAVGALNSHATELAQQPFDSPSVFNFYRPGYVPPQSALGDAGLTAPEMQLADETTAIGWVNFVAGFVRRPSVRTFQRDTPDEYQVAMTFAVDDLLTLAENATLTTGEADDLIDEVEARLCPDGVDPEVRAIINRTLIQTTDGRYDRTDDVGARIRNDIHLDRVVGAIMMIAASTDFLHER